MLLERGENNPASDTIYTSCFFLTRENAWYGGSGSFFSRMSMLALEKWRSVDGEFKGLP
jgi:hypothetical protein